MKSPGRQNRGNIVFKNLNVLCICIIVAYTFSDNTAEPNGVQLTLAAASKLSPTTPEEMWKIVKQTSSKNPLDVKPTASRKGWKTIRLFVSSTFKDFHQEREVLVKEVLHTNFFYNCFFLYCADDPIFLSKFFVLCMFIRFLIFFG